ncbi:MAG: excinuclease ABC subunit UvrC [Oscillospiraceae bacterium]|nr:excinuclease ABC subunit UvrC [Oscillospiraceae bacterium]
MILKLKKLKEITKKIPKKPGVYIMKDFQDKIIYIGKAKILPNRLLQYFCPEIFENKSKYNSVKTLKMVIQIENFDYIITNSEYEALVLECSLIKIHRPKYNILLKDAKGYHYIKATNEKWRRLRLVSRKENDNSMYFGPYMSYFSAKRMIEEACGIFKIAVCSKSFDSKSKPCLNFHINRCSAPCAGEISIEDYENNFKNALNFIENGDENILNKLKNDMILASSEMQFERAAKIRNTIFALEKSHQNQSVISNKIKEQDVISFVCGDEKICVEVFKFHKGNLFISENFFFENSESLSFIRSEFIKTYYQNFAPVQITIDGEIQDHKLIEKLLSEKFNKKIKISIPKKGEQLNLIKLCKENAESILNNSFDNQSFGIKNNEKILQNLAKILNINKIPKYIESYDISNICGTDNVGVMVVFKNGIPLKHAYRKFKIKKDFPNDYASISELLGRRINRFKNGKYDEYFRKIPDIILIDGGMVHARIISEIVKKNGLNIPIFGMVKNEKHKTRALASEDKIIEIKNNDEIFKLICEIQEETHRFAINYHKKLRMKRMLGENIF